MLLSGANDAIPPMLEATRFPVGVHQRRIPVYRKRFQRRSREFWPNWASCLLGAALICAVGCKPVPDVAVPSARIVTTIARRAWN